MILSAKPVKRSKSLHEQTYEALRESILSGEMAPGDRLVETQLAELLQVSRTPIREAIRQLQQEELISADENGWLRVATLSVNQAIDLYDCRIALELLSVTDACNRASDEQLHQVKQCIVRAEALIEAGLAALDSNQLLELDYQFHRSIAQISGNQCLLSLLDQVFTKMLLLRVRTTRRNPRVLEIGTEHYQIYEAIAQRNVEIAVQTMQNHLSASKARVVKELEALRQG